MVHHSVLPTVTIVVASIAGWILGMRNMMITTMDEDYVLVARGQGPAASGGWSATPPATRSCPASPASRCRISFVVTGALLTEIVFSYPGVGFQLHTPCRPTDYPLMQGIFLVITFAVLGANLLADIVYVLLDPRTRQEA